jgi:hypothetical protein
LLPEPDVRSAALLTHMERPLGASQPTVFINSAET